MCGWTTNGMGKYATRVPGAQELGDDHPNTAETLTVLHRLNVRVETVKIAFCRDVVQQLAHIHSRQAIPHADALPVRPLRRVDTLQPHTPQDERQDARVKV